MHANAMIAASYLQRREWGIWKQYKFEAYDRLTERIRNLIDCETYHVQYCPDDIKDASGKPRIAKVSRLLDIKFKVLTVTTKITSKEVRPASTLSPAWTKRYPAQKGAKKTVEPNDRYCFLQR